MATWRYIASVSRETATINKPRPSSASTKEEAVTKLGAFLDGAREEFGPSLLWVALQQSESNAKMWESPADWQEVAKLSA